MKRVFGLFFLCTLWVFGAKGQASFFRNLSVDDGLAQSQVYALLQDHQGTIWMGTRGGGISRYDGKTFHQLNERDGLINNFVYKLIRGPEQTIWIGTNNGISVYDGRKMKSFRYKESQGSWTVYDLVFDAKGRLWIATNQGLFSIENEQIVDKTQLFGLEKKTINCLYTTKNGQLWLGSGSGLIRCQPKGNDWVVTQMGIVDRAMRNAITCITVDQKGQMWFGTYGDGLYCLPNGQQPFRIDLQRELYKTSVFDIFFDKEGICWISTLNKGVVQYNTVTKSFTQYDQRQGMSNNHVRCSFQDNSGTLWFGTSGGGVCQFNGSPFTHYTKESGLGGNFVYSIHRDMQKRLWVGTSQNGVSVLDSDRFTQFNEENGFSNVKVKAIGEDALGTIYLGTEGQGIVRYINGEFSTVVGSDRMYIRQIVAAADTTIWAATSGAGLVQIDANGAIIRTLNYGNFKLLQSRLTCLLIDPMGRIWYGSESYGLGVLDLKNNKKWRFTTKTGMPSGAIRSIHQDNKGTIWVGTAGGGIVQFKADKEPRIVQKIAVNDGLTSANIYLMTSDAENNLFVGSERGLDKLSFYSSGKLKKVKHYAKGDGFKGVETCQNAVWRDSSGLLWFGTINGMTCYNPNKVNINKVPPLISFNDVQLFYEPLLQTSFGQFIQNWNEVKEIRLPYDQNHLSFLFKGVNLRNPDGVEFAWKLEGFEKEWSPWSKEQRIVYSNINSGRYTFLLRAKNEDGFVSEKPLRIAIEIDTPFWRKNSFLFLVGIVSLLLLWGLFKWQGHRIKAKAKKAQESAELAKNVIELEQKALRLQMNPHFIFNALNSIQGLIGTQNEKEARYYLAKFSRLMRQILDNSRSTSITLEEEIATLENYLLIEKFCNGNRFDYTIELNLETESNFVQIPPMLIQPFVENSIKHGFKFSVEEGEKRGQISIYFEESEQGLHCVIRDNGIGREKSRAISEESRESFHVSSGLQVTEERLDLYSEAMEGKAVIIRDLYNENNEPIGTEIQLTIPFL